MLDFERILVWMSRVYKLWVGPKWAPKGGCRWEVANAVILAAVPVVASRVNCPFRKLLFWVPFRGAHDFSHVSSWDFNDNVC